MRKCEMLSGSPSRRVVLALCACAASAVLTVWPGGVRAAMPDEEFVQLCGGSGTADQVRQALKDGANPNARYEGNATALMSAVSRREERLETTRALLSAGADVNAADKNVGETALMAAMPYCDAELARLLLDGGANVNARDESGWTALMKVGAPVTDLTTTEEACLATTRALLAAGADVNAQAESGASALSELEGAAFRALLEAGADVNRRNQSGRTPLMAAIASGRPDAARRLLNAGADPGLKDNDGHDAAWHARHFEEEYEGVEMSEEDIAATKAEFLRLLQGGAKKPGARKKR